MSDIREYTIPDTSPFLIAHNNQGRRRLKVYVPGAVDGAVGFSSDGPFFPIPAVGAGASVHVIDLDGVAEQVYVKLSGAATVSVLEV